MYHRVLPADHPDRRREQPGMYVSPGAFRMQMQVLESRFELVRLGDWVKKASENKELPKFACAVTFDDGWRDNYDYAYPVLKEYGVPATIFVVSGFVGSRYSFWPNRLMRVIHAFSKNERIRLLQSAEGSWLNTIGLGFPLATAGELNQAQLDELVEKCKAMPADELMCKLQMLERLTEIKETGEADMVDWCQLQAMRAGGLIDIGSHTCGHRRLLGNLDAALMREEIEESKKEIFKRLNVDVDGFCYPNGDYTNDAVECVRRNYAYACTTKSGWNTRKSDFMRLKRIGVHEDVAGDRHAFLARLSGLI